jgi:iron-sulfur cluster repair protein YtfE (RIC family)
MSIDPVKDSTQTVGRFLGEDHDHLDVLFRSARTAFAEGRVHEGAGSFFEFQAGLREHIRIEEEILLPKLEELRSEFARYGSTQAIQSEHREIQTLLGLIDDILSAGGDPLLASDTLQALLESHNRKEETVLYGMIDELAGSALASELMHRIKAL